MEAEVDGIKYIINLQDKTAIVDRNRNSHQDVLIPKSINYNNEEYKVTAIRVGAFQDSYVKTVIFDRDSQIETIPIFSFQSSHIEKITLSPSITKIEHSAFDQCSNLIEITIPPESQLQQIETDSFQYTKIESLSIPSKLTKLDEGWNKYIEKLVNITVMPNNSSYIDINHEYLLGKSKPNNENFDLLHFVSQRIIDVKIPDTVEIIGSYLFQNNPRIESIILPPNVKRINRCAFYKCKSLKKFIIPSNSKLQYIGEYAFFDTPITSLFIPKCVRFFNDFHSVDKLKIIEIEDNSQLNKVSSAFNRFIDTILMVPNSKQIIKSITKSKTINVNFITDEGKKFSLDLTPEYNIKQVIEKVAQYLQVEKYQVKLYYKSELLENSSITLHRYWIDDGSTINVTIKKISIKQPGSYQIYVKLLTADYFTLDVLPTDKTRDLAMKLEIATGLQQRKMILNYNGRNIIPRDDSDPTLEEKGVVAYSTLHMHRSNLC